jgi:hypothetical protein
VELLSNLGNVVSVEGCSGFGKIAVIQTGQVIRFKEGDAFYPSTALKSTAK